MRDRATLRSAALHALPLPFAAAILAQSGCSPQDADRRSVDQGDLAGSASPVTASLTPEEANTVDIVREVGPSVAAIHVAVEGERVHPLFDLGDQEGGGSGFVIDDDGRIVTNFHVVAAALAEGRLETRPEASITVSFLEDPEHQYPVRVHGANPDFDLALLEFDNADDPPTLRPLVLGDSDGVEAGQGAIAIGNPFGLHSTVTSGIVSAVERDRPGMVGIEIPFIQTDAAINPGNSGGPLLNSEGEVIGINNAILAAPAGPQAFIGVGFAVPSNLLAESLDALLEGGFSGVAAALPELAERPRLGLSAEVAMEEYPPALREELGLPDHGVVVTEVTAGGPADEAGLVPATEAVLVAGRPFPMDGDVITEVEGEEINRLIDLQQVVLEREAGDTIELTAWREGAERSVTATLEVVSP